MHKVSYNQLMPKDKSQKSDPKTQPGWYTRLPYRYQRAMQAWQDKFKEETGIEPNLINGVMKALDEFFDRNDIDPKDFPDTKPAKPSD